MMKKINACMSPELQQKAQNEREEEAEKEKED